MAATENIATHFARWAASKAIKHQETVRMSASLLSQKVAEGHVCIDLSRYAGDGQAPQIKDWTDQLMQSGVVASDNAPLILDNNRLYLYRHWRDECRVAKGILELRQAQDTETTIDTSHIQDERQRDAITKALTKRICIISGAPGTGKTHTMVQILKLLNKQTVKIAAPTGRAVARMRKAMAGQEHQAEAQTLHKLLRTRPGRSGAAHATPIDADVLIVDEASMVSLELMARLLSSIQRHTRLILMGDRHQLYSVAAGSVFSDICPQHTDDITTHLQTNYRFKDTSGIAKLAQQINQGNPDQAIETLKQDNQDLTWIQDHGKLQEILEQQADKMWHDPNTMTKPHLPELEEARILAVTRHGSTGTRYINKYIDQAKPEGRQIIITTNSEQTQLYNGDIGVMTQDQAIFTDARQTPINATPAHEPAWAITVHKSQGSEFNHITLITPQNPHPLTSRELLYTAITRARNSATILATEQTIRHAINNPIARMSGLADRLR